MELGGTTERRWRERAPLHDTEGWPFRERVAGGGGGWSMHQQRHHRQHFLPRFPFAAYIPRFLFLPALSHSHSSGFLTPFLFYPLSLCLSLSSPSKPILGTYAPTERIAPSSLRYPVPFLFSYSLHSLRRLLSNPLVSSRRCTTHVLTEQRTSDLCGGSRCNPLPRAPPLSRGVVPA